MAGVAVRREDRRFSLSAAAPGAAESGARWLTVSVVQAQSTALAARRGEERFGRSHRERILHHRSHGQDHRRHRHWDHRRDWAISTPEDLGAAGHACRQCGHHDRPRRGHLHHGIWDQSHNAGPKCICRKSNVMETEEMKTREEQCHGINQNSRAEGDGPPGKARSGKPLAITKRGALIGVIIPVTQAWVEHLIDYNWSHVRQSIAEGEQAMAADASMLTIDDVVAQADARGYDEGQRHSTPERLAVPLVAAVVGGTLMQPPETKETLERLRSLLNPPDSAEKPAEPSVHTVRVGELSAERIEQAGAAGDILALTHDRELVGIVIPVTRGLVEFLIEQNMSRVLYNIGLGEKQLRTSDEMTTLDKALEQAKPARSANPAPSRSAAGRTRTPASSDDGPDLGYARRDGALGAVHARASVHRPVRVPASRRRADARRHILGG